MDSFKVIFIFVIINILESFAQLSLQDKLDLLMRLRRVNGQSKFPTIFNKNIYNDVRDIMKEDSERSNRRSFVSKEVPDSTAYVLRKSYHDVADLDPKKYYKVNLRKMYDFHAGMRSPIIASPTMPNQLPEAEPILPGHTLLRPALGMLKSAVKFPHKDMAGGAGVYGNLNNLGISYSGTGERVLYTGFRRNNNNFKDEEKPLLRYVDYAKRERERNKWQDEREKLRLEQEKQRQEQEKLHQEQEKLRQEQEKLRQQHEKLGNFVPKGPPYHSLGTDDYKLREVKRLLKTLNANGVTIQFFDILRLKLEAMEKESNYYDNIKPEVQNRYPAQQYAWDMVVPDQDRYEENLKPTGVKLYS